MTILLFISLGLNYSQKTISDENITNDIDTKLVCTNQTGICY